MSLSSTFKKYLLECPVSRLTSASVRAETECPLLCMSYAFCYGFVFDELHSMCNLLECCNQTNAVSTTPAYMSPVNTHLARGKKLHHVFLNI